MLNELNQLAQGAPAAEGGGYTPHPVGTFDGQVEEISQRTVNEAPVWDVFVRTNEGRARHTLWGFSPEDIRKANTTQEDRDRAIRKIGFIKRLFVDLGVWTEQQAEQAVWSGSNPSILGDMHRLQGKPCQIKVEPSRKKEGEVVVWINAPVASGQQSVSQNYGGQQVQQQTTQQGGNMNHNGANVPGAQQGVQAGQGSSLDDIPF